MSSSEVVWAIYAVSALLSDTMTSARPLDVFHSKLPPSYASRCQRDGHKIMLYSVDT